MVDTALENKKYRSAKASKITKHVLIYIDLVILSIIWLFPFVYLIAQSLSKTYIYGNFFPTPDQLTFNNYVVLFTDTTYPYWRWFLNTLLIALATAVLQTILVLMTSYALSRLRFKGRTLIMKMILILGMFPGFLGMVVILFLLKLLNMNGNIFSLILVYCGGSAMNYYIAKGFFDTIPKSLDEAVYIDGGNNNTVFWKIIMPLSKPIIIYTILISFTAPWGDYLLASYLAQGNQQLFNVAVGLQQMTSLGNIEKYFTVFCAGGVFVSIPIMALFFWLQKYYVEGIAGGAVKG
jgi:arabinogalactan oligomer/maltooligosaccharide transport system permease protein